MRRLGVEFLTTHPLTEEDEYKNKIHDPVELVTTLAKEKAKSVSMLFSDSTIIGSDQLVSFEGEILGKPHTPDKAFQQLKKLNGKTHHLLTAVSLLDKSGETSFLNTTKLTMKEHSDQFLKNYLERDKPFDCAGSYKIEKGGITLFETIECDDFTAIMGLPLIELTKALQAKGLMES